MTQEATNVQPRPYRPSNGSEGIDFHNAWCAHCARDAAMREDDHADPANGCWIIAATFAYQIGHPKYPREWIYGEDGRPRCTAFTTDPSRPVRCDRTPDLFAYPVQPDMEG